MAKVSYIRAQPRWVRTVALDQRITGRAGNTALVIDVPGHFDVAVLSPGGAPRVLDEPKIGAALFVGAVAHGKDPVVQLLAATLGLHVDPAFVELEALVGGVDGHRHGAHRGHGSLEFFLVSLRDVDESCVGGAGVLGFVPVGKSVSFIVCHFFMVISRRIVFLLR